METPEIPILKAKAWTERQELVIKSVKKAKQDLQRIRSCKHCGAPVAIISAEDTTLKVRRTVVIEPEPMLNGWFIVHDEKGAFMDSRHAIEGGTRYGKHQCEVRKYLGIQSDPIPESIIYEEGVSAR